MMQPHDHHHVQRLWAEGDRDAAAARVPIEIGLGTNLVGPPDVIRDRLRAYEQSGVTTLRAGLGGRVFDRQIADLERLLVLAEEAGRDVAVDRSRP